MKPSPTHFEQHGSISLAQPAQQDPKQTVVSGALASTFLWGPSQPGALFSRGVHCSAAGTLLGGCLVTSMAVAGGTGIRAF